MLHYFTVNMKHVYLIAISLVCAGLIFAQANIASAELSGNQSLIKALTSPITSPILTPTPTPVTYTAIYRLFNSRNGDHLYTASTQERDNAIKIGYKFEGIGFFSNASTAYNPVYRFYRPRTGEHFYTADQTEANAVKKYGYSPEGTAFYATVSSVSGLTPVFRLINKSSGFHFYTASDLEKNTLVNSGTFKLEGIAFYTSPISK